MSLATLDFSALASNAGACSTGEAVVAEAQAQHARRASDSAGSTRTRDGSHGIGRKAWRLHRDADDRVGLGHVMRQPHRIGPCLRVRRAQAVHVAITEALATVASECMVAEQRVVAAAPSRHLS